MSRIAWYYARFDLPDDWEPTGYSLDAERGRLEFSSRDGFQGQLAWQKTKRTPDLGHTLDHFYKQYLKVNEPDRVSHFNGLRQIELGQFLLAIDSDDRPCQAALFLPDEKMLLCWTLPDARKKTLEQLKQILLSFSANSGEYREWRLFGLDLTLPASYSPISLEALPASTKIVFEGKKSCRLTFRRWGLPKHLLKDTDLKNFYHRHLRADKCAVKHAEIVPYRDFDAASVVYTSRAEKGVEKLYGRWPGLGFAWHDVEENRIYAWEQTGPKRYKRLEVEDVFLSQKG